MAGLIKSTNTKAPRPHYGQENTNATKIASRVLWGAGQLADNTQHGIDPFTVLLRQQLLWQFLEKSTRTSLQLSDQKYWPVIWLDLLDRGAVPVACGELLSFAVSFIKDAAYIKREL